MLSLSSSRVAAWAPAAPLLCAVHCLTTPLVVSLLPAADLGEGAEPWLLAAVLAVAALALRTELRAHGQLRVLVTAAVGFALWAASLAGWLEPAPEAVTTTLGSLVVAGAMVWSARLRHSATCRDCGCPAPVHHDARGGAA